MDDETQKRIEALEADNANLKSSIKALIEADYFTARISLNAISKEHGAAAADAISLRDTHDKVLGFLKGGDENE